MFRGVQEKDLAGQNEAQHKDWDWVLSLPCRLAIRHCGGE
jgi:hypothetical protein